MKEKMYNKEKLVKVKFNKYYRSINWTFKSEKKFLWFTIRKEGYYYFNFILTDYQKEIPKGHTLKDGIVYENPEVVLWYESGIVRTKIFDNYESALTYYKDIVSNKKWH